MNQVDQIKISAIPYGRWKEIIHDVITVRTSAYFDWNGDKTESEKKAEAKSWMDRYATADDVLLFSARDIDQLVGYLIAYIRDHGEYYISHIGVRTDFKRRGIGRMLIHHVLDEATNRKYQSVSTATYNRYPGMIVLLINEGFYIQGTTWIKGAIEPRISLRKELEI